MYSSKWKVNARNVEGALQRRFHDLPLGHRLWRAVDKGAKFDTLDDVGKLHKVFLAYSTQAHQWLNEGKIMINE